MHTTLIPLEECRKIAHVVQHQRINGFNHHAKGHEFKSQEDREKLLRQNNWELEVKHGERYYRSRNRKMVKLGGEGEGRGKSKRLFGTLIFPKQVIVRRPLLPSGSNPMAGDFMGCGL